MTGGERNFPAATRLPGDVPLKSDVGTMSLSIVPLAEVHFEDLRKAFDSIAREKRYLAFIKAPPLQEGLAFYRNIVDNEVL